MTDELSLSRSALRVGITYLPDAKDRALHRLQTRSDLLSAFAREVMVKYFALLVILISSGCYKSSSRSAIINNTSETPPVSLPKNGSPVQGDDIRSIDFGNFTYEWYPPWSDAPPTGRKIILKNGSMDTGFNYGKEPRKFFLIDQGIKYADLTGDGNEEAVVIIGIITSGTARGFPILVYTMSDGKPKRLWAYETGDRWDYGYHNVSIEDGQLVMELYKPIIIEYEGQKHNMSRSDTYIRDFYKWDGPEFKKVKTEQVPALPDDKNPWVVHKAY